MDLRGRVAVVTGGASGLGTAMAEVFADAGASVAVLDLDGARAETTAAALPGEGAKLAVQVDVGDRDSVQAAADAVLGRLGGCHVLCSNVGVQQFGSIERLTEAEWSWVLNVNLMGTVRTVAAFLPALRAGSGWRRVVLTTSSSVLVPGVRLAAYIASKAAVQSYGEILRMELADDGIGVSVLYPAGMTTRHLESSALARPATLGEWTVDEDDITAMQASRSMDVAAHVASPEHAVRNLLTELEADSPHIITHGNYRREFDRRVEAIHRAFDRLEQG